MKASHSFSPLGTYLCAVACLASGLARAQGVPPPDSGAPLVPAAPAPLVPPPPAATPESSLEPKPEARILPKEPLVPTRAKTPENTVDQLQERIFKAFKSTGARKLKSAFDLLYRKKFSEASATAGLMQSDPLFFDHGYWIAAQASVKGAEKAVEAKNYGEAVSLGQKAIANYMQIESRAPHSPFLRFIPREIARAELVQGDGLWGQKQWIKAQGFFERGFQRFLNSAGNLNLVRPSNLKHYAESCTKKQGPYCNAWMVRFSTSFVRNSEEIKALATYYSWITDRAKPVSYAGIRSQPYKAPDLDLVSFENAMKLYLDEKYGQAIKAFRLFLDDYPRSGYRFRARYWLAQAFTHQQDHEKAQGMYEDLQREAPLSYYGLLAAIASGRSIDAPIDGTLPEAAETDSSLQPLEILHLKRAQQFIAEKAYGLAAYELRDLKPRDTLTSPFLVYLAMLNSRTGNFNHSFSILSELINRQYAGVFSSYGLRMIFPIAYMDLIKKYSMENQIDPILVLSLIKQESAFDEDALSWVGATGLMQLMPQTAVETMPDVKLADLVQADDNIKVGTRYLKKLLVKFNGNIVLSLSGYNAGPNATERWLRDMPAKRGMLEFIETIPYKETRDYVSSIVRNYYWYSRKINGDVPKTLNYFWNTYGPPEGQPGGGAPATGSAAPAPAPAVAASGS